MSLSAGEQYLLELINRARLDPLAEAARYDLALDAGLQDGAITGSAKQVLAPSRTLEAAAQAHSEWMLDVDVFSHTGVDDSSPGDRMAAAGYDFAGRWSWRENLAWYGKTGSLDLDSAIDVHHAGLYRSEGHRVNTFAGEIREIGIAQVAGRFTSEPVTYNASMLTLNYALSGTDVFVTGVAYRDTDDDAFYDIGEGWGGVWVAVDGQRVTTPAPGGYGLALAPDPDARVTLGQGATTLAALDLDLSDMNGKLDIVEQADGNIMLDLSVSARLVSGLPDARLLGVGHEDLTGSSDDNALYGNAGRNVLRGEAGHDALYGGAGADQLYGGSGNDLIAGGGGRNGLDAAVGVASQTADLLSGGAGDDVLMGLSGFDVLDGGTGDDTLTGGGGRDSFIFQDGHDTITDFADNVDQLTLAAAALGDPDMDVNDVLALGQIVAGDAVFDFGDGDVLTLIGISDIAALGNDIIIV